MTARKRLFLFAVFVSAQQEGDAVWGLFYGYGIGNCVLFYEKCSSKPHCVESCFEGFFSTINEKI